METFLRSLVDVADGDREFLEDDMPSASLTLTLILWVFSVS